MKNTGKELERRIADAYRQMGARVKHDVRLAGNQIDVYVESETPDRGLHRIAVEAKDWKSTVGIAVVNKFATIVSLLRNKELIDEGVIVSTSGFSKEARESAQTHSIRLLEQADLDAISGPLPSSPSPQSGIAHATNAVIPIQRKPSNTESLEKQILTALHSYLQEHLGDPKMNLNELMETLGAERIDVMEGLYSLREKEWVDYHLMEQAEGGLVWLTRLGTRVAKDTRQSPSAGIAATHDRSQARSVKRETASASEDHSSRQTTSTKRDSEANPMTPEEPVQQNPGHPPFVRRNKETQEATQEDTSTTSQSTGSNTESHWSRPLLFSIASFVAGVLGNLVAAWIQQVWLGNVFTPARIILILLLAIIALVAGVWIQNQPSLSRGQVIAIIGALSLLTALTMVAFPTESPYYAVHVQDKDTGLDVPNAQITIYLGGGEAPLTDITDIHGYARIAIDDSYAGQPATLVVDATGYNRSTQAVTLVTDNLPLTVPLEPAR